MSVRQGPPGPDDPAPAPASAVATELATGLQHASDAAVLRVAGYVDTLAARGDADRVLDAVRPRLATLRPARRRTLARTLFEPFDAVIVTPAAWRAGVGTIPRSFIAPVTALVRAQLSYIDEIEAILAQGGVPAARLWTDTAGLLEPRLLPPAWNSTAFRAQTGIRLGMLEPLCTATRLLFSQATILQFLALVHDLDHETLRPLLQAAARSGEVGWSLMVALLLEQSLRPAELVASLLAFVREGRLARTLEPALQAVVSTVVDRLEQPPAMPLSGDEALAAQARLAARVAGFSSLRGDMAGYTGQLASLRETMAMRCCLALEHGLAEVRQRAETPPAAVDAEDRARAEDAEADRLEDRLRSLRRLDLAARPLGAAAAHARMLDEAVAFCAGGAPGGWLTRVDRLRLCEILVGAEAARAMLPERDNEEPR